MVQRAWLPKSHGYVAFAEGASRRAMDQAGAFCVRFAANVLRAQDKGYVSFWLTMIYNDRYASASLIGVKRGEGYGYNAFHQVYANSGFVGRGRQAFVCFLGRESGVNRVEERYAGTLLGALFVSSVYVGLVRCDRFATISNEGIGSKLSRRARWTSHFREGDFATNV